MFFHGHDEYGLKKLIEMSIGVDTKKLKVKRKNLSSEDKINKEKFGYIRSGNWRTRDLDSRQLVYMTSDVTLSGSIVFHTILVLISELGIDVLDNFYENLGEFISPYISRIYDRKFNTKLQHSSNSVPTEARSLAENCAALQLSVDVIDERLDSRGNESDEERRRRMASQIKEVGRNRMEKSEDVKVAEWQKLPSDRKRPGKSYPESHAEESWD